MRKSSIVKTGIFSKRTVAPRTFSKDLPPIQRAELTNRRSVTLPSYKLVDILPQVSTPIAISKSEISPKPLILPLKKSISCRPAYMFSSSLKTRFKNINVNSKKIPQDDFLTFIMEKIPTFDFVREKNLIRKKERMLRDVVMILEEDQEQYCQE